MSGLTELALRSSAILLAGLCVRAALKWRNRSAALRHLVLAGAMGAAAAVIPLNLVLPSWDVSLSFAAQTPRIATDRPGTSPIARVTASDAGTSHGPQAPARVAAATAGIWCAGFLAFTMVLVAGMLRLAWIARRATAVTDAQWLNVADVVADAYGLRRRIVLLHVSAPDILATCGILRPRILLPSHASEWSRDRMYVVLCHELAHIRRLDWVVQIGAEVVRAMLWFNPLIWIACACLRRDCEQACDDLVLGRGVEPREYATHLLDLARKCRRSPGMPMPATPMARRSTLERRIADMLNSRLDRRPLSLPTLGIACVVLIAGTLATAGLRAAQTGPATLQGTVYDTTGAVMPGVTVTLEDATQMKYASTTNAIGRFAFSNVQPGHYGLEASLPGFRTLRQAFDLSARPDWDRAITLQVGTVSEAVTVSERRIPSSAPSAAKPAPVRVGGSIRPPLKTLDVRPVYPASMRDAGREGVVPVEAIIGVDGTVTSVRVLSAQVHPAFAVAAVDAVRQWRFTPTLLNASPVEVLMTVSVTFTLSDQ
jgi:TonB family protein